MLDHPISSCERSSFVILNKFKNGNKTKNTNNQTLEKSVDLWQVTAYIFVVNQDNSENLVF